LSDKVYNLSKATCLIVIACSCVYIALEIVEINHRLFDIARVIGNK